MDSTEPGAIPHLRSGAAGEVMYPQTLVQDVIAMDDCDWILKRNCCLSPRQLLRAYMLLLVLSLSVAGVFSLHGAWQVFVYAMAEMAGAAAAFLSYARHATDHEHITLLNSCLLIERVQAGRVEKIRLDPRCTRVTLPERYEDLIRLDARDVHVDIGRFVPAARRQQIGRDMSRKLAACSMVVTR